MEIDAQAYLDARLLAAKAGDGQAFEDLLDAYTPLIESLTANFVSPDAEDRDDVRQEACIAFYSAVEHYDPARAGIKFGLFAKTCIRNRLISYRRTLLRRATVLPLDEDTDVDAHTDPALSFMEEEDYLALSRRVEAALSPYENRVWWLYLSGRTAREISMMLSADERSVQNAIYRIRRKLRATIPNP